MRSCSVCFATCIILALGAFVMTPSRRQFLSLPALAAGQTSGGRATKIVCVGGHPDDPESGCGGTLARYAALGASVTIVYLTRGEAGIPRKSHDEAAAIRSAECEAACRILGAKPVFAGQIDGATVVASNAAESLRKPGDLFRGQPPRAGEVAVAGNRQPGRHETKFGDAHDLGRMLARVFVGQQGERGGFARTVAACATL